MTSPSVDDLSEAIQNYLDENGYIDFANGNSYADSEAEKICENAQVLAEDLVRLWPR